VGKENEGKETHKLSSGGDSGESCATDYFWQGTRVGKSGQGNNRSRENVWEKVGREKWEGKYLSTSVWRSFLRNERQ
jgi:hypothetical protein